MLWYKVSDVKKLNGLVSDLQMFALKTLYIPLPGRHPPSPIVTEESDAQRYDKDHIFCVKILLCCSSWIQLYAFKKCSTCYSMVDLACDGS